MNADKGSLVNELWPVVFLHDGDEPSATAWLELLTSEPALVEATMAVTMRSWQRSKECIRRSDIHSSKALRITIDRVKAGEAYTDGFLAVTLTLSFGELLLQNKEGWEVHIHAAAQAMAERRARGMDVSPPMLIDLMIQYVDVGCSPPFHQRPDSDPFAYFSINLPAIASTRFSDLRDFSTRA